MEKSLASPKKKFLHLQGLRGLAIIAVTGFHFFPKYLTYGYLGVDVFFALSGYLMTMMLSKSPKLGIIEICDFFYRRVKRIVPLYYLITLFILKANIGPALASVAFITNLERPDAAGGYFEKLGLSVDMFTHTWSLSLEMQFYLLFPVIFLLYQAFSENRRNFVLICISILSIFFYTCTDAFLSFNSVFSRIWQFIAGMFVYLIMNPHPSYECLDSIEGEKLLETSSNERKDNLVTYSFVILVGLISIPESMHGDYARILVIVITMQLLQWGEGSFLENRILVVVGEVSYAWYLVHWPFAAQCKYLQITNPAVLFLVLCFTLLFAVAVHYGFERFYLSWSKITVITSVILLLAANGASIFYLKSILPPEDAASNPPLGQAIAEFTHLPNSSFNWPSDFIDWKPFYANMTQEERLKLNEGYLAVDISRSMLQTYCPQVKTNNTAENRCIFDEGLNKDSPMSLLVIGNSYGSNLFPIIKEECRQNFSHMEISWMGGCEVFARSVSDAYFDCTKDYFYVEAVQRVKPDVLFIIQRYFKFMEIINGTNPFDDAMFKIASERLAEIQKHVKKRIFILDDFPESDQAMKAAINKLKGTAEIDDKLLNKHSFPNLIVKMRLARLLNECPKCRVFDYTPQFYFNGSFKFYDPTYFVSFVSTARHLTPAGWERVRPLVRHLCYTQI